MITLVLNDGTAADYMDSEEDVARIDASNFRADGYTVTILINGREAPRPQAELPAQKLGLKIIR